MTKQIRDVIKYDNKYHTLYGGPIWSKIDKMDIKFEFTETFNWKGHHTTYEIIDDKLHVVEFESKNKKYIDLFGSDLPHCLDYFSGLVFMSIDETVYGEYYDFERYLMAINISDGQVVDKFITSNLVQDEEMPFGKYKNLLKSDLLFGRFGKNKSEAFAWLEETIGHLFGKEQLKYSVIPSLTPTKFELFCLDVMKERKMEFMLNKNMFVVSDKINIGSDLGTITGKSICDLIVTIFSGIFTYRVKDEDNSRVAEPTDKIKAMVHGDRSYLRWAIKTVDKFYIPPRLLSDNNKQIKLTAISIDRINDHSFTYELSFEDFPVSTYFDDELLKTNSQKMKFDKKVDYLQSIDVYKVDIESHKKKLKFQSYIDGNTDESNWNHRTIETHDYSYGDTYSDFNGTYAQDHLGYSDDVIYDAFEGDPSLVWNID